MKKQPRDKGPATTVAELARMLDCPYEGEGAAVLTGVADLAVAVKGELVFMAQSKYRSLLETSQASAVILPLDEPCDRMPVIRSADPQRSFVQTQEYFFIPYSPEPGIHAQALVSDTACIGQEVSVGAYSVVGDGVEIGAGTVIHPHVTIYPDVKIGPGCVIHSQVSLREGVILGRRVILHNGVVIGADGFGYLPPEDNARRKIPQQGTVIIEDDVEIGANSTVDRGTLGDTVICRGVKIDNLVQVAHNVEIGENSVVMAQVGIAGSSRTGKNVILAGQAGVPDHIDIGDNVVIAAKTGVVKDIPADTVVSGSPHMDIRTWRKAHAALPQLYDLLKEVKQIKKKLDNLT
jgi:UDP-3-O-[3-hydroxymyristoyl] glucosamine N-acyltransferase